MAGFTESVVEDAALAWLEALGYAVLSGPNIAPVVSGAEREDYAQVVLDGRLRQALRYQQDRGQSQLRVAPKSRASGLYCTGPGNAAAIGFEPNLRNKR